MKRLFSLLMLTVACSFSFATVRTVCNMPYGGGQYTTFDAAQSASSGGDTIYVQGSTINYGSISIFLPLVIIGTGHNPQKTNPITSSFLDITVSSFDVQLIGLSFRSIYSGYPSGSIKKCKITGSNAIIPVYLYNTSNWLIEGNILETADPMDLIHFAYTQSPGTIIQNNVFVSGYFKITGLQNSASDRTYILNNVFLGTSPFTPTFRDVRYCNVDNNIFYMSIPDNNGATGFTNSTANNNITYGSVDNAFYQPGSFNQIGVDPLFVSFPGVAAPTLYNYSWDLSLQATSVGINSGTDGTDRGVFGGIVPKFLESGEPAIAEITSFTITSPTTIAPGGTLTISVTSKRVP